MRYLSYVAGLAFALCASGPAIAGPPFLTDDPEPTPHGAYEIYTFVSGSWGQSGEEGAAGVDFNYGGAPDLQLTATVPIAFEHPDGDDLASGLDNVELAAKWRFLHQDDFGLDVAVFPRVFIPSGSSLSDNHASLLLPVWAGGDWGDTGAFGGGGCAINRGGASQDYCIAGFTLTHRFAPGLRLGAEVFHQTPDEQGGRHSTILGAGATWDISETLHLLGYAGAQLQHRDINGDGVGYASILFTF